MWPGKITKTSCGRKKHIISLKGESHPIFFEKLDVEITMADRLPQ